jgi:hypothetical protein
MTSTTFTYDPFAADVQADPYPAYRRLRDEAPGREHAAGSRRSPTATSA